MSDETKGNRRAERDSDLTFVATLDAHIKRVEKTMASIEKQKDKTQQAALVCLIFVFITAALPSLVSGYEAIRGPAEVILGAASIIAAGGIVIFMAIVFLAQIRPLRSTRDELSELIPPFAETLKSFSQVMDHGKFDNYSLPLAQLKAQEADIVYSRAKRIAESQWINWLLFGREPVRPSTYVQGRRGVARFANSADAFKFLDARLDQAADIKNVVVQWKKSHNNFAYHERKWRGALRNVLRHGGVIREIYYEPTELTSQLNSQEMNELKGQIIDLGNRYRKYEVRMLYSDVPVISLIIIRSVAGEKDVLFGWPFSDHYDSISAWTRDETMVNYFEQYFDHLYKMAARISRAGHLPEIGHSK